MKKTLFAALATASLLFAESYQVNTLSAKQMGMAHLGAGMKLGSESMHFNPGGLGFLDKTLDISAGVTFIIPKVEFWKNGEKTVNDNLGTPLYVYAATSITDWFSAGLSFTTPYGNSADYGKDWPGANLLQDISLSVYAFQPTIAFKPISQFSIGGGPTINFGSFFQSKLLMQKGQMNAFGGLLGMFSAAPPLEAALQTEISDISEVVNKYSNTSISAKFEGDADVAVGFHLGTLYEILPNKLSLGVSYRSGVDMKVAKGKVKGTGDAAQDITKFNRAKAGIKTTLEQMNLTALIPSQYAPYLEPTAFPAGNFEATLPLPSNLNAGVSFLPIEKLLLAFDFQWIGWSAYDELVLTFDEIFPFESTSLKKYEDAFAYRLGAQYTLIDQLDLRCGVYYDESPVAEEHLTPDSPSTDKLGGSIGFSYRPIPNLSIDASLIRSISLFGRDATSGSNPERNGDGIDGRYEVTAWVPSIGLGFTF